LRTVTINAARPLVLTNHGATTMNWIASKGAGSSWPARRRSSGASSLPTTRPDQRQSRAARKKNRARYGYAKDQVG